MTRARAALLVALAAVAAAPVAAAAAALGPPDFTATEETDRAATPDGLGGLGVAFAPSTQISALTPGCASPIPDDYDSLDHDCETVSLTLRRNGRLIRSGPAGFQDRDLGINQFTMIWDCARPGTYSWTVRYTNTSYAPGGVPFTASASGGFQVPRCVPKAARRVPRGVAVDRALSETENLHETQFVSRIRCAASGGAVRSSVWTCFAQRNNTVKECVDRLRLRFFRRDEWRRVRRGVDVLSQGVVSCRLF